MTCCVCSNYQRLIVESEWEEEQENMHLLWVVAFILLINCLRGDETTDNTVNDNNGNVKPNERLFRGIVSNDYDEVKRAIVLGLLSITMHPYFHFYLRLNI